MDATKNSQDLELIIHQWRILLCRTCYIKRQNQFHRLASIDMTLFNVLLWIHCGKLRYRFKRMSPLFCCCNLWPRYGVARIIIMIKTSILNRFSQTRYHFKAANFLFSTMYNLWESMMIYLWITRLAIHPDQICNSLVIFPKSPGRSHNDNNNDNIGSITLYRGELTVRYCVQRCAMNQMQ